MGVRDWSLGLVGLLSALELSEEAVRLGEGNAPSGAGESKEVDQLDTRQEYRRPDSFGRPDFIAAQLQYPAD